jgi:hypothetical protein
MEGNKASLVHRLEMFLALRQELAGRDLAKFTVPQLAGFMRALGLSGSEPKAVLIRRLDWRLKSPLESKAPRKVERAPRPSVAWTNPWTGREEEIGRHAPEWLDRVVHVLLPRGHVAAPNFRTVHVNLPEASETLLEKLHAVYKADQSNKGLFLSGNTAAMSSASRSFDRLVADTEAWLERFAGG